VQQLFQKAQIAGFDKVGIGVEVERLVNVLRLLGGAENDYRQPFQAGIIADRP
jgi:hypothetical protein